MQGDRSVPAGVVKVTPQDQGWYLVEIGRERRGGSVKRVWLRETEARQLVEQLDKFLTP